jgi:hypothetical protein
VDVVPLLHTLEAEEKLQGEKGQLFGAALSVYWQLAREFKSPVFPSQRVHMVP